LLALWSPHEFWVVSKTGGDPLLKASFRDDEWLGSRLYPSGDGKRFAVTISAHKGGSAFFDIDSHSVLKRIMVYELPSGQAVYTLDAKQQKINDVSGVALSPDGSLMAILTDGVVEVYRLPPVNIKAVDRKDGTPDLQVPIPTTTPKQ
jgi:WD40 repeat protein